MTDGIADIGTHEAESVDRAIRKVRMRKVNPGADNADPNTLPGESYAPKRRRLDPLQ